MDRGQLFLLVLVGALAAGFVRPLVNKVSPVQF